MNADNTAPWLEISVEVAVLDAEIAADLLRQACPGGVAIETPSRLDRETETYVADGDGTALVKGYMHPGEDADRLQQSMRVALQTAPLQRPAVWREPTILADADWRDSWKRYFGVLRIPPLIEVPHTEAEQRTSANPPPPLILRLSKDERNHDAPPGHQDSRLVIVPSWEDYSPRPDDIVLRIDPGMAFGTGQHQTTAMCLAALEATISGGESVLDLGCGSGILAIAAAKLGASRILAVDTDPQAIKATIENAAANEVQIEARTETLESPTERFDIIVANISGLTLARLSPVIAASLTDGGTLIASGFLDEAVDGVRAAFESAGLHTERIIEDGQWRAIIATRQT